jgi:hypothetical protein
LVLNVNKAGDCVLFFMDFGYYEKINFKKLFKLPLEFTKTPFAAYRIKFSNIPEYKDEAKNSKAIEIIKNHYKNFGFGIVV